jgi:hypothetical protein
MFAFPCAHTVQVCPRIIPPHARSPPPPSPPPPRPPPPSPRPPSPCLTLGVPCSSYFCCAGLSCVNNTDGLLACGALPEAPAGVFLSSVGRRVRLFVTRPDFTGGINIREGQSAAAAAASAAPRAALGGFLCWNGGRCWGPLPALRCMARIGYLSLCLAGPDPLLRHSGFLPQPSPATE